MITLISLALAVDVDTFSTAATTGDPAAFTRLGTAETGKSGEWDLGLGMDYANAPLSEQLPTGRAPVLDALATVNLTGGYSFGWMRLDGALPTHFGADGEGAYAATGDVRFGAHLAIPGVSGFSLNTAATLPTGADARYVGGPPRLLTAARAGREFGRIGLLAVAGAVLSLPEESRGLKSEVGPVLGMAAGYRISESLSTALEVSAQGVWGFASLPVEATLSTRMRLHNGVWANAAAAAGIGNGVGASRWRAIVGIGFSKRTRNADIHTAPGADAGAAQDPDDDDVPIPADRCPDQAETVDGFEDEDGCPELDGDGDGVAFATDACPSEPILPQQDPRYSDGCPHIAELAGDHVAIIETILFREGRSELVRSADPLLKAVRDEMVAHPEIAMFLVEGHTNTDGPDAYNVRLSDERAFSVMRWLVEHGVDSTRLLSKGFGEARPLALETAPDGLLINRRVEFRVVHIEDIPADARQVDVPSDVR